MSRGLSQDAVAKAARMARASISNIESGNQGMSVESLYSICKALSIEPAELLPPLSKNTIDDGLIREAADRAQDSSPATTEWVASIFRHKEAE